MALQSVLNGKHVFEHVFGGPRNWGVWGLVILDPTLMYTYALSLSFSHWRCSRHFGTQWDLVAGAHVLASAIPKC